MKKLLFIIALMLALVFVLASCGDSKEIENVSINENGDLILVYTDGSSENLGKVKGDTGEKGNRAYHSN